MEKNQLKIRIVFGFIIAFFFLVIISGQIYYSDNQQPVLINITESIESLKYPVYEDFLIDSNVYNNCYMKTINNPTIILRIDDLGAWHYNNAVRVITEDIVSKDMSVVLGVIPFNIEKDKSFMDWARQDSIRLNPKIEIAQHGYIHSVEEFKNLSYSDASKSIESGRELLMSKLGVVPVTFIPPYNVYSNGTSKAVKDNGFKIISSGQNEYSFFEHVLYIGYNTKTYDFDKRVNVPVEETIKDCEDSLKKRKLCVVMIHPQDYMSKDSSGQLNIDNIKYAEFLRLLSELDKLNAEFSTFRENLRC